MDTSGRRATHFRISWALVLAITLFGFQATRPSSVQATWSATLSVWFAINDFVGDGLGRVTSDDGNIDCSFDGDVKSGACTHTYSQIADFVSQFTVKLTIDPAASSYACYEGSTGCGGRDETLLRDVTFNRGGDVNKTVEPSFTWGKVLVYGLIYGNGSVNTGGGDHCDPFLVTICRMYRYGSSVTWTAVPGAGSNFSYWEGAPCDAAPLTASCTFTVTQTTNFTLQFGLWRLIVKSNGKGTTCVVGLDMCVAADASKSVWLEAGRTIGVTATPASGQRFDRWNNTKCAGQDTSCAFSLTGNVTVTAFYEPIPAPTRTPTPTAKPTPKPTPKPTVKPTAKPTAKPSAAPSAAPAPSQEPSPEPSVPPEPLASPEPLESPPPVAVVTAAPVASTGTPPATEAPAPAASTEDDELPIVGVLALGLGVGLGVGILLALAFVLGRRSRTRTSTSE